MNTDKICRLAQIFVTVLCLLLCLSGCETFRKKFVRKPKAEKEIKVVIDTDEYESQYSVEEVYKKYYLFWRAVHDELINSLSAQDRNRKKQISSAKKIVENLQQMRQLLLPEMQEKLDPYILGQEDIIGQLQDYNLSQMQKLRIKSILEKQKRQIQKEFTLQDVQPYLVRE